MALPTQAQFDAAIVELNDPAKTMLSTLVAALLVESTAQTTAVAKLAQLPAHVYTAAADPADGSTAEGDLWFDTANSKLKGRHTGAWIDLTGA